MMESPRKRQAVPKGNYKSENDHDMDRVQNVGTPMKSPIWRGKCENDHDMGIRSSAETTKKSPAPSAKHFMVPTISAASKVNPPKKKILGERNESLSRSKSFSFERGENGCDLSKARKSVDYSSSPRARFIRYNPERRSELILKRESEETEGNGPLCSQLEESISASINDSSYDPVTNYLSPRPKFLWYDPDKSLQRLGRNVTGSIMMSLDCTDDSTQDDSESSSCCSLNYVEEKTSSSEIDCKDLDEENNNDKDLDVENGDDKGDVKNADETERKDHEDHKDIERTNKSVTGLEMSKSERNEEIGNNQRLENVEFGANNGEGNDNESLFNGGDEDVVHGTTDIEGSDCECDADEEDHGNILRGLAKFVLLFLVLTFSACCILQTSTLPSLLDGESLGLGSENGVWFEENIDKGVTVFPLDGISDTETPFGIENYLYLGQSFNDIETTQILENEDCGNPADDLSLIKIEQPSNYKESDVWSTVSVGEVPNDFSESDISADKMVKAFDQGDHDEYNVDENEMLTASTEESHEYNTSLEQEASVSKNLIEGHDVHTMPSLSEAECHDRDDTHDKLEAEADVSGDQISDHDHGSLAEETADAKVDDNNDSSCDPTSDNDFLAKTNMEVAVTDEFSKSFENIVAETDEAGGTTVIVKEGTREAFTFQNLKIIIGASALLAGLGSVLSIVRNRTLASSIRENNDSAPAALEEANDKSNHHNTLHKINKAYSVPVRLQPTMSAISSTDIKSESDAEVFSSYSKKRAATQSRRTSILSPGTGETPSLRRSSRIRNRALSP